MPSVNRICDVHEALWKWLLYFTICTAELGVRASPGRPSPAGSSSAVVVVGSPVEERQNLSCYSCNSQLENEGCRFPQNISRTKIRTCPASHRYCTVTRVDYSVDPGSPTLAFSIERSCSEQCTTECVAVGERLRLYLCRSCCQETLCNTGNQAGWLAPTSLLLVIMAALTQLGDQQHIRATKLLPTA